MEGRWKRLLASGILFGIVGCSSSGPKKPAPFTTPEPPLSSISAKQPVPAKETKDGPIKVETLLAFADAHLQSAALPDRSERDRDIALEAARTRYQEILKREPKNVDGMLGMAKSYKIAQDRERCVDWYQRALKARPNSAPIWGEMGQSLDGLKDRDGAITCYHTATKIDPRNKDYRKALGFALARTGRYDEGFAWLCKCMTPADAHVCLARMMDHNGQGDLANQHFAMALKAEPNNELALQALNSAKAPNDGIPVATPVQTVKYEQYTPVMQAPAAPVPSASQNKQTVIITPPTPPVINRAPDPLPSFINQNGAPPSAPAPIQSLMQPR